MYSMFVTVFKILSGAILIALLFFVITQREIIFKPKTSTTISTSLNQSTEVPIEPLPVVIQKSDVVDQSSSSTSHSEAINPDVTPATNATKVQTVPTPIATVTKTQFIPLEEGQSDTDSSYRPAISPCKVTMTYKLGRFDPQFGMTQNKFIEEIDAASSLWGSKLNKTLFKYDPNGSLTINLIYDERQARTDDINNLSLDIENAKTTADSIKKIYEQEKLIYFGDGEQLTKDTEAFKVRYQIYTDKVTMYNSQGGAPQAEYEKLTKELEELRQLSKTLTERRDNLMIYMEAINTKVNRYNELVAYINGLIEKSNSLGAKKFTEGKFTPKTNTIDIYQYTDLIKLRRVIAHELGHVLGINHTESVYSIMYAVNSATTTILDEDDIQELYKVCPQ